MFKVGDTVKINMKRIKASDWHGFGSCVRDQIIKWEEEKVKLKVTRAQRTISIVNEDGKSCGASFYEHELTLVQEDWDKENN